MHSWKKPVTRPHRCRAKASMDIFQTLLSKKLSTAMEDEIIFESGKSKLVGIRAFGLELRCEKPERHLRLRAWDSCTTFRRILMKNNMPLNETCWESTSWNRSDRLS